MSELKRTRKRWPIEVEEFRWKSDCPPICEMKSDDLYALMHAYAERRVLQSLELACKAVCVDCAEGKTLWKDAHGFYHEAGVLKYSRYQCPAAPIRKLMDGGWDE
jgi:hypothetical protein